MLHRRESCLVLYYVPSFVKPVALSRDHLSYIDWQLSVTVNKVTVLEKQTSECVWNQTQCTDFHTLTILHTLVFMYRFILKL